MLGNIYPVKWAVGDIAAMVVVVVTHPTMVLVRGMMLARVMLPVLACVMVLPRVMALACVYTNKYPNIFVSKLDLNECPNKYSF